MCRNIKTLYNFSPPATEGEIRASAIQFVRKISGFTQPSQANEAAFNRAVDQVAAAAQGLLGSLVTTAPPRDRETEAAKAKAKARSAIRFARSDVLFRAERGAFRDVMGPAPLKAAARPDPAARPAPLRRRGARPWRPSSG